MNTKLKKILSLVSSCAVAVGSVMAAPAAGSAESVNQPIKTDIKWYDEIITLVQDDVADNGQHAQWYYMTDHSPFRTDGLNITYNQNVVTDDCSISFKAGDSPSKYYNGKTFEYDIPIDILFQGKDINSSVIAQIGKKDDANLDHQIDVRDAAIISRDVKSHIVYKKTLLSEFAKFLVTGNRKSNVYALKAENAATIAKDLALEALKRSTGKKLERDDGTSGCSLSISSAKGMPGETISMQVVVKADNSFEALDAVVEWKDDTLNARGLYGVNGTNVETAIGDGKMAVINYGDDKIKDGAVATISVTIPEDAKPGEDLELYFSDVKTFSVLDNEGGSKNISDSINIKGAKVTVTEPKTTKPAVTTKAVTTTTTTTVTSVVPVTSFVPESTVTSISGFCFYPFNAELPNCTIVRPNKTVDMELTYDTINKVKATPVLPDGMKLVKAADKDGNELSIDEDGSFTVEGRKAILTIELPKDIEKGEYNVEVELDALNDYNKNIQYQLMLPNMPVGSIVGTITVKDEIVTTPVTTTTTTATTVTSVSTSDSLAYTNKLGEGGLYDATAKRTDKTVVMKYYSEIGPAKGEFILPEGMKIIDIKGGKFTDDGKVLMDSEMGEITIEFPENIEPGLYEVTSKFGNAKPTGNIWLFFYEKSYLRIEDEEVTTPVTTASAPATTTTVTTTTAVTTPKTYQLGDANKDGKVDIRDAAYIAQVLSRKKPGTLETATADFNKDGKVNIRDAASIAKYLSGKK